MKCGQLVLLHYPFTDRSGTKIRPALIVSADQFNFGDDVIIVPLTSSLSQQNTIVIKEDDSNFSETRLRKSSCIKWSKPFVISKSIISRKLGILHKDLLANVHEKIRSLFIQK